MTNGTHIISKLTFDNLEIGPVPQPFYDNNKYTNIEWSRVNTTNCTIEIIDGTKYVRFNGANSKIYTTNSFIKDFNINNFEVEFDIIFDTLKDESNLFALGGNNEALNLRLVASTNPTKGLCLIQNTIQIKNYYKFENNKKYTICFSKINDTYYFYIDGLCIGYRDVSLDTTKPTIPDTSQVMFACSHNSLNDATKALYGKIANVNFSYGQSVKHYNSYTKYGNKLISYLKFDNNLLSATGTQYKVDVDTIKNEFIWNNLTATYSNGYFKIKNLSININELFTLIFDIKKITNYTTELLSYGDYKVTINLVQDGIEKEPEVIVNEYTTSALNFENGLVDQVSTTVWQKEGTANVTSVNKIFGENSFETKALGDSLSTTSNIITGGATPFTIEFYALIKGSSKNSSGYSEFTYPLISKNNNSGGGEQTFSIMDNMNPIIFRNSAFAPFSNVYGTYKFKLNEINKNQIVYDGAAIRWFINDELAVTVGTLKGFRMDANTPFTFYNHTIPAYPQYNTQTIGIIDNINIFDGEARVVRNPDPYEEFLLVDLAFDGENNSTKIIDNGGDDVLRSTNPYNNVIASLLHFDNNINDETGIIWTQVGNPIFSTSIYKFSNSSINITPGNYLKSTYNSLFDFSTMDDFTIELFINIPVDMIAYQDNEIPLIVNGRQSAGSNDLGWNFVIFDNINSSSIRFELCKAGSAIPILQDIPKLLRGVWHHIAVSRYKGTILFFIDGILVGSSNILANTAITNPNNHPILIGSGWGNGNENFYKTNIFIDELRIIKGKAVYTESFSPPTQPFTYIKKNKWIVNGNAKISTDQKFDGFSSLYLPDFSSTITSKISFNFSNDWTVSFQFKSNVEPDSGIDTPFFKNITDDFMFGVTNNGSQHKFQFIKSGVRYIFDYITWFSNSTKIHNITIIKKVNSYSLYINNKFIEEKNFNIGDNFSDNISLIISPATNNGRSFIGYYKNFKIYKGVAVIPENPTGKIQLDFDNNLVDKYGNSTWTNNGVTFDQVNSVKGYAAYFNSSNNTAQIYTNSELLNFENKNFKIELDYKTVNNNKEWSSLIVPQNHSYPSQHVEFSTWNSNTLVFQNLGAVNKTITGTNTVLNQWYNTKLIRNNNCVYITQNNVITGMANYNTNDNVNFNISNNCTIGGVNDNKFGGYIDNFKSYKENLLTDVDIYKTNESSTITISGDMLRLYSTSSNGVWFKNKDCPNVKDFILKTTIIKTLGEQSIILRTSNWQNVNDTYAYLVVINGSTIGLAKGSNSTASSFSWLKQSTSLDSTLTNYNIEVIANDNNIKIYCNDVLYIDYTGSDYLNSGLIGFRSYGVADYKIDYYSIEDLNNNLLYYKDWKTKINNVIDRPAVHLPLETNAINTGFTPLTINSVGNPIYTTIDGKKCIKFESGKYLTINSNNIFNLGTNSDFYIEFEFYPLDIKSSGAKVFFTSGANYASGALVFSIYQERIILQMPNFPTTNNIVVSSDVITDLNKFYKIKLARKETIYTLSLDNSTYENRCELPFDLSVLTTIGTSYWELYNATANGYMSNFKMFVGTSEIPESYNDKKVLDLDFKPTSKSYLFKDNNNKCVIHPVNITQRDYQDSQYCCAFNGTDQYLQLGKNELFNFGNDDFVIEVNFKVLMYDNWSFILSNNISSGADYFYFAVSPNDATGGKLFFSYNYSSTNYFQIRSTNKIPLNEIINAKIVRNGQDIKMYINDTDVTDISFSTVQLSHLNLNAGDNTKICSGSSTFKGLTGYIYSIKVLRNTSDISLLEEVEEVIDSENTNNTISLTNGIDNQEIEFINNDNNEFKFIHGEDSVKLISNNEILEVSKLEENSSDELIISNGINTYIKDVKLYNDIIEDNDIFEGNTPIDTQFDGIDIEDITTEFDILNVVDQGNFIIKGFFEGQPNNTPYSIRHKYEGFEMSSGIGEFHYNGIDKRYINDYVIINLTTNETIPVPQTEMIKGYINISVELSDCGQADFAIRVIRRLDNTIIGVYEFNGNLCNIPNLDCNKNYDCIIFDRNAIMESRSLSNRTPTPY